MSLIYASGSFAASDSNSNSWQSNADRPVMQDNLQYHIHCKSGDVHKYVLMPGDPDRVELIAREWDESRLIARHREYTTYSGKYSGVPISACSTGIGGPGASIAIEELAELGADTFIRVGTCGAIQENIKCGDLIICSGAVRHDGASDEYIEKAYPAIANHEVVLALIEACERLGKTYHVGISCSTSSFYTGQSRPGFKGYTQTFTENIIKDMQKAGVASFEMEAATIFTLAGIYNLRAGAVLLVAADRNKNQFIYSGSDDSIQAANLAVKILAEWDNLKAKGSKRFFYPGLIK
ncbi:MAG: uridine phosphorylase [Synergistaceae bacterium]|nr:uridine phosphorylase [Synergistaceae bacterium]